MLIILSLRQETNGCAGDPFQVTATIRSEPAGAHDDLTICSDVTSEL
jgi:hypothetical protein